MTSQMHTIGKRMVSTRLSAKSPPVEPLQHTKKSSRSPCARKNASDSAITTDERDIDFLPSHRAVTPKKHNLSTSSSDSQGQAENLAGKIQKENTPVRRSARVRLRTMGSSPDKPADRYIDKKSKQSEPKGDSNVEITVPKRNICVATVIQSDVVDRCDSNGDTKVDLSKDDEFSENSEETALIAPEDSEDEEDIGISNQEQAAELEVMKDDELANYVRIATSGVNLNTKSVSERPMTSNNGKASRADLETQNVFDRLDSGAGLRKKYIDFEAHKRGSMVRLSVSSDVNSEENRVLQRARRIEMIAKQQRAHDTNDRIAGRKWFDMATDNLTPELKRDFELIRLRNYLDPKKFYKSTDYKKGFPKHFQVGTVVEGPHEFKSSRIVKKARQATLTDEIMADADVQKYTKRVYSQIQRANMTGKKLKKKIKNLRR